MLLHLLLEHSFGIISVHFSLELVIVLSGIMTLNQLAFFIVELLTTVSLHLCWVLIIVLLLAFMLLQLELLLLLIILLILRIILFLIACGLLHHLLVHLLLLHECFFVGLLVLHLVLVVVGRCVLLVLLCGLHLVLLLAFVGHLLELGLVFFSVHNSS